MTNRFCGKILQLTLSEQISEMDSKRWLQIQQNKIIPQHNKPRLINLIKLLSSNIFKQNKGIDNYIIKYVLLKRKNGKPTTFKENNTTIKWSKY